MRADLPIRISVRPNSGRMWQWQFHEHSECSTGYVGLANDILLAQHQRLAWDMMNAMVDIGDFGNEDFLGGVCVFGSLGYFFF